MSGSQANAGVVFDTNELLPEDWRSFTSEGPVRAFNPGLLRDGNGWILAYRIVGPDGVRRIGACRLDAALRVVANSQVPLSDHVRFRPGANYPEMGTRWFADPRLYRFGGRIFVYWNSGWHEPRNCQFVQQLDARTLRPIGHPRELLLKGERQKLEKNWTFFATNDERDAGLSRLFCVYTIAPHRVLQFSLEGDGDIVFEEVARCNWSPEGYPASHGGLRGGAPPCRLGDEFWTFCHSVHDGADGYRYAPAVYCFSAMHPFAPTAGPIRPLELSNPYGGRRVHERLNTAVGEVIYPCGAAWDGARWLISHGINDEHCAISSLEITSVEATLRAVSSGTTHGMTRPNR